MPVGACCLKEALRMCAEVFHTLKSVLKENGTPSRRRGRRGRLCPNLKKDEDAFKVIVGRHREGRLQAWRGLHIAIDAACSSGRTPRPVLSYLPKSEEDMTKQQMVNMWKKFADNYPIISMEDGYGRGRLRGLGDADQGPGRPRPARWATTCSSPTPSA